MAIAPLNAALLLAGARSGSISPLAINEMRPAIAEWASCVLVLVLNHGESEARTIPKHYLPLYPLSITPGDINRLAL
jgi:hypothetical protein